METHVNTYQGLNKDAAYDSIPNSLYIDALDIRITTTTGESMGGFTNMQGNEFSFSFPTSGENFGGWEVTGISEIIGYTTIRNKIILFVTDDNTNNPGWIYEVTYNPDTRQLDTLTLKYYNSFLGFSKLHPIEALGRYESPSIQRVYWTDYYNFLRSINLASPTLSSLPVELIDIYPDVTFVQPLLQVVSGGGNILTGEYQFAYRLITNDGKQTLICPPSNLIHIVSDSETVGSADYNGNPTPIASGKSITISVDTTEYINFKTIEFISIYHSSSTAIPEVKVVEQIAINGQSIVSLVYTSNEGQSYPIELLEFTQKNYAFKTCKTLTQKDNSLVIANLISSKISIQDLLEPGETFNAKTRRYRNIGGIIEPPYIPDGGNNDLLNAFNQPLNKDAHWDSNWQTNEQYKYQSDGVRLGGEGPNINYNFHLEPMTVDGDTQAGFANVSYLPTFYSYDNHDLNDGYGTRTNTTFPNNASPYISGLLRGYKRGETYRFGIVFNTNKGETTFVEYLGDIKFPDISEEDSITNASGTNYFPLCQSNPDNTNLTIAYNLGIQFNIDFSTCPSLLDKITNYQIVRVKREDVDRRRLTQGIIKTFWWAAISGSPAGGNFDFKINNDTQVVHLMPEPGTAFGSTYFNFIGDQQSTYNNIPIFPSGSDNRIKSQYLAFCSAEISFNHQNTINRATEGAGLLITGAYNVLNSEQDYTFSDQSDVALASLAQDYRLKLRNCIPVTFNSIENVKRWSSSMYLNMSDTSTYTEKITPKYGDFYMRNYWAIPGTGSYNLNAPAFNDSEISRGNSSIVGKTAEYTIDPITQQPVPTIAETDFFKIEGNTTLINGIDLIGGTTNASTPVVDVIVPRAEVYGGYSTSALEVNTFIACSPIIEISNLNPIVFGGDIFMNMFTLQTSMLDFNLDFFNGAFEQSNSRTQLIVTESLINQDLAYGATTRTLVKYTFDGKEEEVFRQETNNTSAPTAKDKSNMYAYNPVNSRENSDVTYFIKPSNAEQSDTNDIRAYLSNVKINGETIDSWAKFGVNNFYDIDDYGPINKIINWRDSVFFIQDRAVGVYAINRAAITTTADGVPTQLGTGLGFGKHQYFSKEHGSIHQWGVKTTESGIYIFDALHRKIFIATGEGNNPLSEAKGIHSLLQALPPHIFLRKENSGDNPIIGKGVHIGKDSINDEVIFTFLSITNYRELTQNTTYVISNIVYYNNRYYYITNQFTTGTNGIINVGRLIANSRLATAQEIYNSTSIVYDELAQQFSTRLSQTPKMWIDNGDILLSANPLINNDIYIHNIGEWGVFYDNPVECNIQLVLNPQADINKVLRTLEFNSIVRNNNKVIDREVTITAFRIQTQYQDTLKVPFSADRIKRRFDKWRVKIPRDQTSTIRQGRLRSTYFIVTLYFDNTNNKELIMNRLLSYFDYQIF